MKLSRGSATLAAMVSMPTLAGTPTDLVTTYDAATYGSVGTITFNDWGYTGPAGVGANDYQVGTGFDSARIGQIQHVVTKDPDWLTPDAPQTVYGDPGNTPEFTNANMDGGVNFFKWGYTTPANSTFSNMQIDKAGNYQIAKTDMSFGFYDTFLYRDKTGVNPDQTFDTGINFQPYTVSDASGWCGSTLVSNPNGLEVMAGQVTFDFAMDVYFETPGGDIYSSTQLAPGFVMRSYGDYTVDITTAPTTGTGEHMFFTGSAVGNNTDPTTVVPGVGGSLDPDYLNQVSFLGAGVLPKGVWVSADSFNADGTRNMREDFNPTTGLTNMVWDVTIVDEGTPDAVWHGNAFASFAYLLRADGTRTLEFISPTGHSDYVSTVPVPPAVWLFGSGLLVLIGAVRRGSGT